MNERLPHWILALFFIGILSLSFACNNENINPALNPTPEDAFTVSIDTDKTFQKIAGFGGANRMWGTQFLKPAEARKAFSTSEDGLGLSIFRVRIASNRSEWPRILESVQEAQKYGVKIQASPWSPPAALKSNNSDVGGYLLPENYGAFKDHLNDFVAYMADNGVDIYAISIQNEPDIQVSYESCDWNSGTMANFIRDFGDQIQGTQLAAPESFNFSQSFTNALLNDADVAKNIDLVAGHIYGGGLAEFRMAEQQDKEIWMTEYLLNLNTGNSSATPWASRSDSDKWEESLEMLSTVHESMSLNWNAYIWWYLQRYYSFIGDGTEGTPDGEILKRGFAYSHYSKFIRPGFVRVDAQVNEASNLQITAYNGGDQIVVVIVNPDQAGVSNVNFKVPSVSSATAYTTTEAIDRAERPINVSGDRAILSILGRSVTTVVIDK